MYVEKMDIFKVVEDRLSNHQTSLEKNLKLQFDLVNTNIAIVIAKVDKINGRVSKSEGNIRELQDARLNREKECPHRNDIALLNKKLLENVSIESYIFESDRKRIALENKRNRILLGSVAVVSLLVGVLTLIINYMFFY